MHTPVIEPKSPDLFAGLPKPMGMNDSYRELLRFEVGASQRAWMRMFNDMQTLGMRWCERRQEMIRDSAAWLEPNAQPGDMAMAWRRWASNSAQRWIDDVSDQLELAMKATARLSETLDEASGAAPVARGETKRASAKPKRARKANGATTH